MADDGGRNGRLRAPPGRGRVRVRTGARVHFGFGNLSLAHRRLYGGIGAGLAEPGVSLEVAPAEDVDAPDVFREHAERSVARLGVDGVRVAVATRLPEHVGLGSGTQHALAVHAGVAAAHGIDPDPRAAAPTLGRGSRSGVGVATFEDGGIVVDAGHPSSRFTADPRPDGSWSVPHPVARHRPPEEWRVLLVTPAVEPGRAGSEEDTAVRSVVENADPGIADRIAGVVTRELLPAVVEGDLSTFGESIETVSRLNGAWFADQQGGVYRPAVAPVVESLSSATPVEGAGQSSWGPTVFGITAVQRADRAREAGRRALDRADVDGTVRLVPFARDGARVERVD